MTATGPRRLRVTCLGTVQGVGFRPAVFRLAVSLGLAGWVRNGPEGVVVEIEGEDPERFVAALPGALPPLARVDRLETVEIATTGESSFEVTFSAEGRRERALVPPDTALCTDCRREMASTFDRRFRYPFTTCTNCGPRFTLVRALPYDRERTSMGCFPLCPDCRREYEDPADRRFHAEPVCCPECGPRLWLVRPGPGVRGQGSGETEQGRGGRGEGREPETVAEGAEAIDRAREALREGRIVAVKGLGGFQLACRADLAEPVDELRRRKRRPTKPLAVMVEDLAAARALAGLSEADEALLASSRAPVVLATGRAGAPLATGIAPGLADVGVMLPTTPLHVELLRGLGVPALVMTSGNASDEPICRGNREALDRLGGIADLFLLHDRDVVRRADDSVVRGGERPFVVRRARGFVPEPLPLPVEVPAPVLALGPFLQATACLAVGGEAFVSQHVGDLDGEPARAFLEEVVDGLEEFLQARAELVAVDEHPDYPSTALGERLAAERNVPLVRVQHHLAHAAAVLAEHGAFPKPGARAAALALDGTGWGSDGTAWGGEWLLLGGDLAWRRLANLEPLPLVGGEAAVREPWRVLVAALASAGALDLLPKTPLAGLVAAGRLEAVARLAAQPGWPLASGAGRLFEGAGALLGLTAVNGWEGEAAALLEALAAGAWPAAPWPTIGLDSGPRAPDPESRSRALLPSAALLAEAARRIVGGEPAASVAAGFHATFCRLAVELTVRVVPAEVRTVAVGGGCLVNRLLRDDLTRGLAGAGYDVLLPQQLPPGDGGIAYGQAVLGAVAAATGTGPREED